MKNVEAFRVRGGRREGGVGRSNSIVTRDTQKQKGTRRKERKRENSILRKKKKEKEAGTLEKRITQYKRREQRKIKKR